jgi:hypothetical protein
VTYIIIGEGKKVQGDGTQSVGGTVDTGTTWTKVNFYDDSESFNSFPVVLSTSQTVNGSDAIVTRHRNVDFDGFEVKVQEEEAEKYHPTEQVGYFAIEASQGELEGVPYEADVIISEVDNNWYTLSFNQSYTDPTFMADIRSYNRNDTCNLRYRNLSSDSVEIRVQEEQSTDNETYHVEDSISYLVFGDAVY